jgi:hypothetical protein
LSKQIAPAPVLSADGRYAAFVRGVEMDLIDIESASMQTIILPHDGQLVMFSPHAERFGVVGSGQLSIFQHTPDSRVLSTLSIPAALTRLAVGEHNLIVGTTVLNGLRTVLSVWHGETFTSAFAGDGMSLGELDVGGVYLDDARSRVILWGKQNLKLPLEKRESFAQLLEFTATDMEVIWDKEDLSLPLNGYMLPLRNGSLGAYNRDQLVILAPSNAPDSPWRPMQTYDLGNLERAVASPDGSFIAHLWSSWDGKQDHFKLRVVRLADGSIFQESAFDALGQFVVWAVDDTGQATLAYSEWPDRIVILRLQQGQIRKQADFEIRLPR